MTELDDKRRQLKEEAQYIMEASMQLEKDKKEAEDALRRAKALETEYKRMISDKKKAIEDPSQGPACDSGNKLRNAGRCYASASASPSHPPPIC